MEEEVAMAASTPTSTSTPAPAPTLEQRAIKALTDEVGSSILASLVNETETAIATATNDAEVAEATALDAIASPDPVKARAVMEEAKFKVSRLRSLLPRLQERFGEAALQERYNAWVKEFDAFAPERDAAAEELRVIYTEITSKIVPLLIRIEQIDAKASRIALSKPVQYQDGRWLQKNVEMLARGIDGVGLHGHTIMKDLKLPNWENPSKLSWPLPSNIDWSTTVPIVAHPGGDWWKVQQAAVAQQRAEDAKRAEELVQEEGRTRNNPALWKRG
jgi:hypothetical protein